MFIINGELINAKTHPQEYEWMMSKFEELRKKKKKFWTYSAFQRRAKILREDGKLVPQKNRQRIVSIVGTTEEATGVYQTWAYANGFNALNPDGSGGYSLKKLTMKSLYSALRLITVFMIKILRITGKRMWTAQKMLRWVTLISARGI